MAFQIVCDGSIDLGNEITREKGIRVVPFYVSFDGEHYEKEGEELGVHNFYRRMEEEPQVYPRTSLPSVQDYADAFQPILEEGQDALCICLASELSGSYNSAMTAADLMKEKYPNQLFMADCSTVEEALHADELGFDFIGTTLVGYTEQSRNLKIEHHDFEIIREIVSKVKHRVIAEGNINTPQMAKRVIELGAFSVVVGSMITRPQIIAKTFADALDE